MYWKALTMVNPLLRREGQIPAMSSVDAHVLRCLCVLQYWLSANTAVPILPDPRDEAKLNKLGFTMVQETPRPIIAHEASEKPFDNTPGDQHARSRADEPREPWRWSLRLYKSQRNRRRRRPAHVVVQAPQGEGLAGTLDEDMDPQQKRRKSGERRRGSGKEKGKEGTSRGKRGRASQ